MGLGVTPSQILGRGSRSTTSAYSSNANEKIAKMQGEIDVLTAQVAEVDALKEKVAEVDSLKEQLAFIMSTINKGNDVRDLGSPNEKDALLSQVMELELMKQHRAELFRHS